MIRLDLGLSCIGTKIERFKALVVPVRSEHKVQLSCVDINALVELLSEIQKDLDGYEDFTDAHYMSECEAAGISQSDLHAIPLTTPGQRTSRSNIESGDLCELLGCMALISFGGFEVHEIHPKNLLKLNPRVSDPGMDIIGLSLDQSSENQGLLPNDRLLVVEAKSSKTKGTVILHERAKNTHAAYEVIRFNRELRLLKSQRSQREGKHPKQDRIKYFVQKLEEPSETLTHGAMLATSKDDDLADGTVAIGPFAVVFIAQLNISDICERIYKHRRAS